MKKMITILASVATCLLFGAVNGDQVFTTGTSFESLTPGAKTVGDLVNYGDDGTQANASLYWSSAAPQTDELGSITNYPTSGKGVPEETTRPDNFADGNNEQYLLIDSTAPISRTIKPYNDSEHPGTQQVDVASCKNGIFLDTLVKFTAADEAFKADLPDGDKIAIEYVEQEAETNIVEDVTNIVDAVSGFVVRAGYMGQKLVQTNYLAAAPVDFAVTNWHRLTVRTVSDIDGNGQLGFKIYLDEEELAYSTDDARFATAAGDSFKDSTRTIFPSVLDTSKTNNDKLSAVAFSGNGSIDDVTFTTEVPNFIKQKGSIPVTVTLDQGVTNVTLTAGEFVANLTETGTCNLPAEARDTDFTVKCWIDTDAGYQFAGITNITAGGAIVADEGTIVIGDALSIELAVLATRDNVYYMDGETKVGFATLSAAFATAPAGTTLKLGYDYVVAQNEGIPVAASVFEIADEFVLDLNGKTLNGGGSDYYFMFNVLQGATLTVIDSVDGDAGSIVYTGSYGMFGGDGDIYIGSTTMTDYGPVFEGLVKGEEGWINSVVRGKFSYADNTVSDEFVAVGALDLGSDIDHVGDYWVVAPAGGTFALTTTGGENAEIVTDPVDVSALTEATSVTITATATNGFTYATVDISGTDWTYNSNDDAISMTTNVSEKTEIEVPNAVAKTIIGTYEVTVIPTNNTTYVVTGAASNVGDVYTVATAHSITITVTPDSGYEYVEPPTGWTAGQDGAITIEVSAAATVEIPGPTAKSTYPSYMPDDAAMKAKYDTWAGKYGADTGSAYETAFLLNIAPAAEDQTLKEASITISGSTVTITANQDLKSVNGKVYIKTAGTLAGLESALWGEATLNATTGAIEMTSNGTAAFFKIKVDFTAGNP